MSTNSDFSRPIFLRERWLHPGLYGDTVDGTPNTITNCQKSADDMTGDKPLAPFTTTIEPREMARFLEIYRKLIINANG